MSQPESASTDGGDIAPRRKLDRAALPEPSPSPKLFRADSPPADLEGDRDAFGHKAYAVALASALEEAEAPFTCGLFGPFGLGKTTVIDELRRQLRGRTAVVVFDAWRYEGDELRRQFLREAAADLERAGELPKEWTEKHLKELDTTTTGEHPKGLLAASPREGVRLLLTVALAACLIWLVWRFGPTFGSGAKREVSRVVSAALIAVATYLIAGISRVFYVPTSTVTMGELKPELFSRKFSRVIADLKKSSRLVVVIDNLDRCSAARIEQVFFTLSTFLEPLSLANNTKRIPIGSDRKKKDAVFLIAADDQALRTHLNEMARRTELNQPPAIAGRGDVGQYADEYLRKIFKASIAMKQIIGDDMRSYVAKELSDFSDARGLSAEDSALLVQLVSAALRYNPRRIKEFGNNLELMLRVIEVREAGSEPQIAPPISGDVLLVAKVRLIEEEWPDLYSELYVNPRLLAQWYTQIADFGSVTGSEQRFNAFLNIARSIPDKNLRALFRLKQSRDEVRLPRSVEFHEALVEGQADIVDEIVTAAGASPNAYAARLTPIVNEEVDRLYTAGARNAVEIALSNAAPRANEVEIRRLMVTAADSRPLRLELRNSPPQLILEASTLLDEIRFNQLIEPWVELDVSHKDSPERTAQIIEALIPQLSRISPTRVERLSHGLAEDPLKASISTYLPLIEADPALTPPSLGEFAVGLLKQDFDISSDAFRLVRVWLRRTPLAPEPQDDLAELVTANLVKATRPDQAFFSDEALQALVEVVANLDDLSEPDALQAACLAALPAALEVDLGEPMFDLLDASLRWKAADSAQTAAQAVSRYLIHDLDTLMTWVEERTEVGDRLAFAVAKAMQGILLDPSADFEIRLRAAATIYSLDADDHEELLSSSPHQLINAGDWAMASKLLNAYRVCLYDEDNAASAIERAEAESPAVTTEAFDFIERFIKKFPTGRLDALRDVLIEAVTDGDEEEARRAMDRADRFAGRDRRFRSRRAWILRTLFDSIAQADVPPPGVPSVLAERASSLDADRRASFVAQLERWITNPAAHQADVASAAQYFEDPGATERSALVAALINAETAAVGNPALRRTLLESAQAIRGGTTSAAAKRLRARLAAIKSEGGVENQQLISELGRT